MTHILCSVSCFIEDNTDVCLCAYLLLYANDCYLHYVHMLIYRCVTLQLTMYMMLIGYAIYTKLGVLVNACMVWLVYL